MNENDEGWKTQEPKVMFRNDSKPSGKPKAQAKSKRKRGGPRSKTRQEPGIKKTDSSQLLIRNYFKQDQRKLGSPKGIP